jgi:two-component system sensor histidine kinase and response regulator WspE
MSDLGEFSLLDLFREEVRSHTATLGQGLLDLESGEAGPQQIEPLMRAAHSIKGAARIVGVDAAVGLAHGMEDAFVAAGAGQVKITPADIDVLLRANDLLAELTGVTDDTVAGWGTRRQGDLAELNALIQGVAQGKHAPAPAPAQKPRADDQPAGEAPAPVVSRLALPEPIPRVVLPEGPIEPGEEHPLFDLFREELRTQTALLDAGVQARLAGAEVDVEALQHAAHSIKGAARIVGVPEAVALAGALEEVFVAVQQGRATLPATDAAGLVRVLGVFADLVRLDPETLAAWQQQHADDVPALQAALARLLAARPLPENPPERPAVPPPPLPAPAPPTARVDPAPAAPEGDAPPAPAEAVVRVTAESLNRLMSLAGESLVQARWLQPFATSLQKLKKQQDHLAGLLDGLAQALSAQPPGGPSGWGRADLESAVAETRRQATVCRQVLAERMGEFEDHSGRAEDLNSRLYREVIVSRMRPFADGAHGFPRLVRDMARRLGKNLRLEIDGLGVLVDRDILEKLEAPLTHLLRNAVDHGAEPAEERRRAGKPEQALLRLEVRHRAGMLAITVSDDGGGIDVKQLQRKVIDRGLATAEMAAGMSEPELLEFLFLPGFSTAQAVTEYSGRGVGLDVVQTTIRKVGGSVRVTTRPGQGTAFHLQLPLTLSVLRAVLVDVGGECYAFPHNRIDRLLRVPLGDVRSLEHRQYVTVDGNNVGLVLAAQVLELDPRPGAASANPDLPVLLMSDETGTYGLIVEAFRGEQDLVVRPLDPRLGKVPDVSAAALLDDGSPVLIVDVEDLIRSMDHYIQSGSLRRCEARPPAEKRRKRVLVVDDSITVREVERQLLRNAGYEAAAAVDGQDGWNQLRAGAFDLVVTDVDMPRMTGLELVKLIRDHERLKDLPVVIVSYKDREEDRLRGLDLGANFYLTKSSFHDNTFLRAVADLIGEA